MRENAQQSTWQRARKAILMLSGILFVGLGILGAFLPLLPTTIFLILASACFVRSSERLNNWLTNHRVLGKYLRNYRDGGGMSLRAKFISIGMMWASIILSLTLVRPGLVISLIFVAIAIAVSIHIVTIKPKHLPAAELEPARVYQPDDQTDSG